MVDEVKEFSREEAQGTLFHGAPQPSVVAPVVQRAANIPVPPPLSIKSVEKGTPVAKQPDALSLVQKVSEAQKQLQASVEAPKPPSAMGGLVDELVANWKPLAIGAGVVVTGMAAKRYLGRKEPAAPTVKVEPSFATAEETATFKPIEQPAAPSKLALESEAKFGVPLSDVERHFDVKITNLKDAEILSNSYKNSLPQGMIPGIPTGQPNVSSNPAGAFSQAPNYSPAPPAPQGGFDPARIGQPLQDPLAGRGYQTPIQEIGPRILPSATETLASGGTPTQIANQTAAQAIDEVTPTTPVQPPSQPKVESFTRDAKGNIKWPEGMSAGAKTGAELFAQQYPDHAQKLAAEGKFAILGGGAADNNLFNAYGKELRKTILNEVNQGQMGGAYSNYLDKINPALKALPPETGLGKTLADLRVNNPEGALHGPLGVQASIGKAGELVTKPGAPSKLIKAGGPALLLMGIADAAKAAQQGNMAPSKELGFDLGTGALLARLLGGPAAAAGALAFGSTGLNAGEQQQLDYIRKVGGGRGIAPPSAYQR